MIRLAAYAVVVLFLTRSTVCADWNSTIAASNPLNWYRLDENSGTIAYDYGSEGRNGTFGGQGWQSPTLGVAGFVGTAVEFVGDGNDKILIDAPLLTSDWSAEFILKKTANADSQALIEDLQVAFGFGLKLEQWRNTYQLGYTQSGVRDYYFSPAASVPLDQFVHVTYVKTAGGVQAYINGNLVGSNSTPIPLPRYGISGGFDPLYAIVDEVVIYDRALTSDEVATHFASVPEPSTLLFTSTVLAMLPTHRRRAADNCPKKH
jgi:hypothetical protein